MFSGLMRYGFTKFLRLAVRYGLTLFNVPQHDKTTDGNFNEIV